MPESMGLNLFKPEPNKTEIVEDKMPAVSSNDLILGTSGLTKLKEEFQTIVNRVRDMEIGESETFDLPMGVTVDELNRLHRQLINTRTPKNPGFVDVDFNEPLHTVVCVYILPPDKE